MSQTGLSRVSMMPSTGMSRSSCTGPADGPGWSPSGSRTCSSSPVRSVVLTQHLMTRQWSPEVVIMETGEARLIALEEKGRSELGSEHADGTVWRVMDSHTTRLSRLDETIWQGGDSLSQQLVRLRTEIRMFGLILGVLMPVVYFMIEQWIAK